MINLALQRRCRFLEARLPIRGHHHAPRRWGLRLWTNLDVAFVLRSLASSRARAWVEAAGKKPGGGKHGAL